MFATSPRSKRIRSKSFAGRPSDSESERTVSGAESSAAVLRATGSTRRLPEADRAPFPLGGFRRVLAGPLPVPPVRPANGRFAIAILVFADEGRRADRFETSLAFTLFPLFLLLDVFLQMGPQRVVGAERFGRKGDVRLLGRGLLFRSCPASPAPCRLGARPRSATRALPSVSDAVAGPVRSR